jgi:hemolysin-activating ACP:hemolysin acyltransferase
MDSEGLILLIWIASLPESRMVKHFLLKLFSEKYYCIATLKRAKNPSNSRKVSFYKRELRPLNG